MKRFYTLVISRRKLILILFFLTAAVCMMLRNAVIVNYDMKDYLPEHSHSTRSIQMMKQEFDGGIPNARIMIRDVTIPQALELKKQILAVDGVQDVMWLDDTTDLTLPLSSMNSDTVNTYYQNSNALFTVTIDPDKRLNCVTELYQVIDNDDAMFGDTVSTVVATKSTVKQVRQVTVIAVLFVLFILLLNTGSWFEPVIILAGLGVAILINAGSNLIFGEISFVTNAAGSILLLAVSLDYSVFLMHRYEESLKEHSNPETAMIDALCKSTGSILSSGLTTVIGFFALTFMEFLLGPDLGLALAKGVLISLLTVFLFTPSLAVALHRPLQKYRHRPLLPDFRPLGKVACKLMLPMVCVFVLIIVPSFLASNANDYYYGATRIFGTDTRLGADGKAINQVFGKSDACALLVPKGDTARETELSAALKEIPEVKSVISYVDLAGAEVPTAYLDRDDLSRLVSERYSRFVITASIDAEGQEAFAVVKKLRATANQFYPDTYFLAGESVSTYDLMHTITADMLKVNLIAIGAVFLVLMITMKSLVLPVILVLSIETAIWINCAIPYFNDSIVFYISYLIITSIQLGATVDYAILFTDRYREFRRTLERMPAIVQTVSSVTMSILTSGSALIVVGFLMGYISTHGILSQLGFFLGRGALFSLAIVLFVLPGLLYLSDRFITGKSTKAKSIKV